VKLFLLLALILAGMAPVKIGLESSMDLQRGPGAPLGLDLRERIGQSAFVAVLGGFRSVIADLLFIDGHAAWERTDWTHLLLRMRQVTELQPHVVLFWDMAGWHMAWNASIASTEDRSKPPFARQRAALQYIELGRDFLLRGIAHNPGNPQLYEALARLYRDRLHDHARASENFYKASQLPGCASYDERFAAYELSYCEGREDQAYEWLRRLYLRGEKQRLPTLINRLRVMEEKLALPPEQRIP
jgi:hypothetical protein